MRVGQPAAPFACCSISLSFSCCRLETGHFLQAFRISSRQLQGHRRCATYQFPYLAAAFARRRVQLSARFRRSSSSAARHYLNNSVLELNGKIADGPPCSRETRADRYGVHRAQGIAWCRCSREIHCKGKDRRAQAPGQKEAGIARLTLLADRGSTDTRACPEPSRRVCAHHNTSKNQSACLEKKPVEGDPLLLARQHHRCSTMSLVLNFRVARHPARTARGRGKRPEEKQRYNSCGSPGRRIFPHG